MDAGVHEGHAWTLLGGAGLGQHLRLLAPESGGVACGRERAHVTGGKGLQVCDSKHCCGSSGTQLPLTLHRGSTAPFYIKLECGRVTPGQAARTLGDFYFFILR